MPRAIIFKDIQYYHWKCFCLHVQGSALNKSLPIRSGVGGQWPLFGTPSYPSPLDCIRSTRHSMDLNATFPSLHKGKPKKVEFDLSKSVSRSSLSSVSSEYTLSGMLGPWNILCVYVLDNYLSLYLDMRTWRCDLYGCKCNQHSSVGLTETCKQDLQLNLFLPPLISSPKTWISFAWQKAMPMDCC